jgi:hypothetical protein
VRCEDHSGRLPGAFAGRQDGGRSIRRPVEAHHQINWADRGGQPVGLAVWTGEAARAHADSHGVFENVRFEVGTAKDYSTTDLDLVTFFAKHLILKTVTFGIVLCSVQRGCATPLDTTIVVGRW